MPMCGAQPAQLYVRWCDKQLCTGHKNDGMEPNRYLWGLSVLSLWSYILLSAQKPPQHQVNFESALPLTAWVCLSQAIQYVVSAFSEFYTNEIVLCLFCSVHCFDIASRLRCGTEILHFHCSVVFQGISVARFIDPFYCGWLLFVRCEIYRGDILFRNLAFISRVRLICNSFLVWALSGFVIKVMIS